MKDGFIDGGEDATWPAFRFSAVTAGEATTCMLATAAFGFVWRAVCGFAALQPVCAMPLY